MDRGRKVVVMLMITVLLGASLLIIESGESDAVLSRNTSLSYAHGSFIGEASYDYSGTGLDIVEDVNGDGFDDILIGADGNDDGASSAGKVYLIFGKEFGWGVDVGIENADASFIGEVSSDQAGSSVAGVGDVNGDGFNDLLIGAYANDDGGTTAGKTYLIFGKRSGWETDVDLSNADASFLGEAASQSSGEFLAGVGDVNSDGFDDFLISAIDNDESANQAGKVYLILGKSSGWRDEADLSIADASFRGETANDVAGTSISGAGDVNGDGYNDFLIGAPMNGEVISQSGQTYLVFGKTSGWARNTSLSTADASFRGESASDHSGETVAGVGDINDDGYDDFLIASHDSDDGASQAGEVYIFEGDDTGWAMDTSLGSSDGSYVGEEASDELGWALSGVGDTDEDGCDDFIISTRYNDEAHTNAGQTYLINGRTTGYSDEIPISACIASFLGENTDDYSGSRIAGGGDLNGDGKGDMLIGASSNDEGGTSCGQTYVILCDTDPPPTRDVETYLDRHGTSITITWERPTFWPYAFTTYYVAKSGDGSRFVVIHYANSTDRSYTDLDVMMGTRYYYSIVAVDVNGDYNRFSPIVSRIADSDHDGDGMGDKYDDDDDNDGIMDHMDFQMHGRDPINWGTFNVNLSSIGTRFYGETIGDSSGLSMDLSGDVNGDGIDDLVMGAHGNDEGGSGAGKVYLFFGKRGGWTSDVNLSSSDASFIGEGSNDRAGIAVTIAGDVNGDGYDDIIIGADEYEPMGGQRGRVYIIFGKPCGWRNDVDLSRADVRLQGEDNEEEYGKAVASGGDVNGDGYDDILIGAPKYEVSNTNFSGRTYLVLGRASFPYYIGHSSVSASFYGADDDGHLGCSVALDGDLNGDGIDDMIIGERSYRQAASGTWEGKVNVILGKRSGGWSRDTTLTHPDASYIGERGFAGWSVAYPGDVNGDGLDDMVIGAPDDWTTGSSSGQTYLVFGKTSGWSRNSDLANADASFWGENSYDRSGYNVDGAGDINSDGYDDILIGAPNSEYGGYDSPHYAGKTYIIFGGKTGWEMDTPLNESDISFYGETGEDSSGYAVAGGGDPDKDGRPDIMIGAWTADHYGLNTGTTYLLEHKDYEIVVNLSSEYREGSQGIYISWDDPHNGTVAYGIYRGVAGSGIYRIANTTSSNYTDWTISLGLTYSYYVVAFDPFGTQSPLSDPIHVLADKDSDKDGIGNVFDWDDDGDGVPDGQDMFPLNSTEWLDSDLDGIGNNYDTDDDNDGIPDVTDPEPLNPAVSVDLDELYDRLVDLEGNLSSSITSMQSVLNARLNTVYANLMMNIRGMNATMRTYIASQITPIFSRLNSLQASIHGHIEDFWDDYNTTQASRAQYLIDMNDRIMLAISDLEDSMNARFDGMAGPEDIINRIDDLEGRYNISIADLSTSVDNGFTSLETLMDGEFTELEAYIGLRMVQLQNEMELVNMSLHHHMDQLATTIEELMDEDIADLVIVIDGEMTTLGELLESEFTTLDGTIGDNHDEIMTALAGLTMGDPDEPINLTSLFEDIASIRTLLEQMDDLDEVITTIETMETTVETSNTELSDNDDSIQMFLYILIALVAVAIILLIVNIIFTKTAKKEKDESWGEEKK